MSAKKLNAEPDRGATLQAIAKLSERLPAPQSVVFGQAHPHVLNINFESLSDLLPWAAELQATVFWTRRLCGSGTDLISNHHADWRGFNVGLWATEPVTPPSELSAAVAS